MGMNREKNVVSLKREENMAQRNSLDDHELLLDAGSEAPLFTDNEEMLGYREIDAADMSAVPSQPLLKLGKIALAAGALLWAGFSIWLFARRGFQLPAVDQIPYVITVIAIPLILIAVLYQLLLRSSVNEADRFIRITAHLRRESEALDMRLAIVNQQLDSAREAMRDQATLLEQYGASASLNLETAARTMTVHAHNSAKQAELVERAGLALAQQFGQLVEAMPVIEDRATRVTSSLDQGSAAVTDKVDKLEAKLDSMTRLLEETRSRTMNATQSLVAQLMQIQDASRSASDEVNGMADLSATRIGTAVEQARKALDQTGATLDTQMADLTHLVDRSRETLDEVGARAVATFGQNIDRIETRLGELDRLVGAQNALLSGMSDELTGRIDRASERFQLFERQGVSGAENLAQTLDQLAQRTAQLDEALQSGNRTAEAMIARSETLLVALDASVRELDEGHPSALARLDDRIDQSRRLLLAVAPEIERLEVISAAILGQARDSEELLSGQGQKLTAWLESGERALLSNQEQVETLRRVMEAADTDARRLTDSTGPQLVASLLRVKEAADQAGDRARQALSRAIAEATAELGDASEQALSERLGEQFQARMEEISAVADRAVQAAHVASDRLMRQLLTIADTTASIEQRITEADEAAEKRDRDNFSNRSALLIESLNSISIDVSKLLSQEVGDSSWAAYLKGDRGVFTRRAVSLLNNGEAKSIGELYDEDSLFRDNVNRYIHDFEAMLRNVLSARDGSSLGVTLLSSDIGKLYVALAQAIDRLRN